MTNTRRLNTPYRSTAYSEAMPSHAIYARVQHLAVSLQHCWNLLTQPALVQMWFGDLSDDFANAKKARLDFGDGDFFVIDEIVAIPCHLIEYSWRFLALGEASRISWRISGVDADATIELTDTSPRRTQSSAEELRDGWLDFLQRLEGFVALGKVTRYDFRDDFEASVDLAVTTEAADRWLARSGGLLALAHPIIESGVDSDLRARVDNLLQSARALSFELSELDWLKGTPCRLQLRADGPKLSLAVEQSGWHGISHDPEFCLTRRRNYSSHWRESLANAKQLIEAFEETAV